MIREGRPPWAQVRVPHDAQLAGCAWLNTMRALRFYVRRNPESGTPFVLQAALLIAETAHAHHRRGCCLRRRRFEPPLHHKRALEVAVR